MKAREFVVESVKTASAEQVWNYVDGIHPDDQKGGGFLKGLIMRNPQYELKRVPLSSIHIPDQEYDDEEQEPEQDPYNRVQTVDPEHAGEYSANFVDHRPIVIDSQGWIIDGNHRAWAASELLNRSDIMAWVPVAQLNELGNAPADYKPNRKRKRSLFHATVDNQWVDVFFDRSEFNDTLHITFAVNGDYDTPSQPTSASKSTVRILSTVLNIIKQQLPEYIAKARPPGISFTAKGDNRASLYRRYFVPVVQNILGPKWAHEEYPSMGMTVFHWRPIQKNTDKELSEIARIPQGDFGDKDTLVAPKSKPRNLKPLPGGSRFTYAVDKKNSDEIEIMIFDGKQLVAELDIFATQDPLNTWEVNSVATDPDYRGQGLGKALYGIALSILKLTIEAGEIQTKHGQQMWIMLNSIPGVEVKGYAMTPTEEYRQKRGDQIVDQNATWTRYTFPVEPGRRSMRSTRRGTGIYSSNRVSMIAKWTGQ